MKPATFKNRLNSEIVICDNTKNVQIIDGVEYLLVHRANQTRVFLMRRDALELVNKTPQHH